MPMGRASLSNPVWADYGVVPSVCRHHIHALIHWESAEFQHPSRSLELSAESHIRHKRSTATGNSNVCHVCSSGARSPTSLQTSTATWNSNICHVRSSGARSDTSVTNVQVRQGILTSVTCARVARGVPHRYKPQLRRGIRTSVTCARVARGVTHPSQTFKCDREF